MYTVLGLGALAATLAACGNDRQHGALIVSVSGNQPGINCTGTGCACSPEGATAPCGHTEAVKGKDVVCAMGTQSCTGGVWGACDVNEHITKYAPPSGSSGSHLLNLAESPVPCGDKCDPYCSMYVDTPPGIDPGPDFMLKGGTLTLPGREGGGSCNNVVITPTSGTITVTSLRPLVADPPSIGFSATCGAGGPAIVPSWIVRTADSDVARIDATGVLRVVSGAAKTVQVTGATASGSASATVNIVVDIDQVDPQCDGSLFDVPPSGTDPGKTLYPYAVPARPVVFPQGLGGPLVQWSTGGVAADCVKVTLDYPRGSATPSFHWSRVFAVAALTDPKIIDRTQPAAPIPDDVWAGFARAASGQSADIVVQRHATGAPSALSPLPSIPIRFASDSIRGTAFFTQYLRRFRDDPNSADTDICSSNENGNQPDLDISDPRYRTDAASGCANGDCSANSAPACPVGNCTQAVSSRTQIATLQALDLANPAQGLTTPFGTGSSTRCTACHSISADGSTLVASDYALSGLQTIAKLDTVNGRAHATPIADAPTYSWSSSRGDSILPEREQSRGLSFAALTPDGHYVLQGPNFWGNTDFDLHLGQGSVRDAAYPAGGKRYFLLDVGHYRKNVRLATTQPLPAHTAANGALTGNANAVLTIDGSGVAVGDAILVKDEPVATENGIYVVEVSSSTRPFRLVRRADNGGAAPLAFADKFRVERGQSNGGKYFHIAAPSSGMIQPGATAITFALYTTVMAATSGPLPSSSSLVDWDNDGILDITGDGVFDAGWVDEVPIATGLTILVKDEAGARASRNGIYELVDVEADPWVLRRRSEADADPELVTGARVRVNQGQRFGGKTFVLTSGSPSIGNSALAFTPDELLDEGTKYDRGGVASTLPTMMFPNFAPDGSALVYVNGDADTAGTAAAASGWRRGLSLLSFNQNNVALPFSNKRRLLSTYNASQPGAVLKWPFFEPDSRGVVYQEGSPDEFCAMEAYEGRCTGPDCTASTEGYAIDSDIERACFKWCGPGEYGHGNGAPTTRGYWPGRLQSISTDSSQKAELAFLNGGLSSQDALAFDADGGKAYQPNVLPFSAGGYRWVIFTSTRAYGNQLNAVGTHFSCSAPLLWIAALDDAPAGTTDRSYPAFLLPGQNLRSIWADNTTSPYGRHFVNERGFLVPNACKTEHAGCTLDSECCGGSGANPTTQCRLNTMTDPPSHTCEAASSCRANGDACSDDGGCCSGLCVQGVCSTGPRFTAAAYTRVFASNCMPGYKVRWGNFEWHASAPSSSHIDFRVAVSDSSSSFDGSLLIGRADTNNINVPPSDLQRIDVGSALRSADMGSAPYLRVSMEFYPAQDGFTAPVLYDWDQRYDCVAAE